MCYFIYFLQKLCQHHTLSFLVAPCVYTVIVEESVLEQVLLGLKMDISFQRQEVQELLHSLMEHCALQIPNSVMEATTPVTGQD